MLAGYAQLVRVERYRWELRAYTSAIETEWTGALNERFSRLGSFALPPSLAEIDAIHRPGTS